MILNNVQIVFNFTLIRKREHFNQAQHVRAGTQKLVFLRTMTFSTVSGLFSEAPSTKREVYSYKHVAFAETQV